MAFRDDVIFPEKISYGSKGGPLYEAIIIPKNSGFEQRAALHIYPRHEYDAAFGIERMEDPAGGLEDLIATFHVCEGVVYGMLYKDWADYKTSSYNGTPAFTDQVFDEGDGATTVFYLRKNYTKGSITKTRAITKPRSGTILIGVNGVLQTETTHYTIDYTTGAVTFVTAPPDTHSLTWGGEFYVPVRFDTEKLDIVLSHYISGQCTVPLKEIKV